MNECRIRFLGDAHEAADAHHFELSPSQQPVDRAEIAPQAVGKRAAGEKGGCRYRVRVGHRLQLCDPRLMRLPPGCSAERPNGLSTALRVQRQEIGQFLQNTDGSENKVGRSVLANCSLTILLRQHPNEIEAVRHAFKLTEGELLRLRQAAAGEGLLLLDQESCWFTAQFMSTPSEKRLLSTTAQERAELAADGVQAMDDAKVSFFRPLSSAADRR